ncbi:hypothetical protein [Candidatus Poriferisodalis sp.]|uniref:hypothetical protein n=1 Tax=Candidatus Poriferisodalis sp. TaxID=3101277 RepID=UPI003AF6EA91
MTGIAAGGAQGDKGRPETAAVSADEASRGREASGSIRGSIPLILAELRKIDGLSPATRSNLLWLAKSLLEYLARVAGDRWDNVALQMFVAWCDGDWADPDTGRRPGQSRLSKKQRRWAVPRAVQAAIATGSLPSDSAIAELANTSRQRRRPEGVTGDDPEHIALAIELWCPRDERSISATHLLATAREWVTRTGPPSGSSATAWLRIVTDALLWSEGELGTADPDYVLHPRNVEAFTMDPARGWSDGWRAQVRSVLRRVGREVSPQLWPDGPVSVGARDAVVPYSAVDEFSFRESALMAGRKRRCERLWLVAATLGAGLRGTEAYGLGPGDLVSLDAGRLGIEIQRDRQRIVPIRERYTALAIEARDLCGGDRFFESDNPAAPSRLATRLAVDGLGRLKLHRARATFVCAHINAGTPLDVLHEIAGPITGSYLQQMLAHCAEPADPVGTAIRGLTA